MLSINSINKYAVRKCVTSLQVKKKKKSLPGFQETIKRKSTI